MILCAGNTFIGLFQVQPNFFESLPEGWQRPEQYIISSQYQTRENNPDCPDGELAPRRCSQYKVSVYKSEKIAQHTHPTALLSLLLVSLMHSSVCFDSGSRLFRGLRVSGLLCVILFCKRVSQCSVLYKTSNRKRFFISRLNTNYSATA